MKPTYSDSSGSRWTVDQINRKSDATAKRLLQDQLDEYGYNFCTRCKRNDCKPIDVSHTISRLEAERAGTVEVLWDIENQVILGRACHKDEDGLNLFK